MFIGILLGYVLIWNPYLILEHLFIMSAVFLILLLVYLRYVPRLKQAYVTTRRVKVRLPAIAYYVLFDEYLLLLAWKDFLFGRYSILWEQVSSTRA
jgi:biofilm PGA synthesis N-glycosyltransferase PgaC